MFSKTVVLALLALGVVGLCHAQSTTDVPTALTVNAEMHPAESNICAMDSSYKVHDKGAFYKPSFGGLRAVCTKDYLDVCATETGPVVCNKWNAVCQEVKYDWADAVQHPTTAAVMEKAPEFCSTSGGFRHPDTSTLIVAQIIIGGITLIAAFIVLIVLGGNNCHLMCKIICGFLLVDCLMLLFSYYYINAILVFTCAISASLLFSMGDDNASAVGFAIILAVLFWTTFENGLGSVQHHSRFKAGDASSDYYEVACNNYYRGLFYHHPEQHGDSDNLMVLYTGFCRRAWLGACLFFMIFAQHSLLVLVGAGALLQFGNKAAAEAPESECKKKEVE